ncbi:MAG: hypothetical protein QG657_3840 [Acidobacteriota bacterium]|nr:hypothetical protein [Acidobacteriota bacterium]
MALFNDHAGDHWISRGRLNNPGTVRENDQMLLYDF